MLQYLPKKFTQAIVRSALPILLIAICAFCAESVFAQSVLLSNLKTSKQTASPMSEQSTNPRSTPPKKAELPDPFLEPETSPKIPDPFLGSKDSPTPPPRVSSILQASGTDEALDSQESTSTGAHEDLDALLWLRTSAEFDAITRQTFVAATRKMGEALVDPNWNALVSQEQTNTGAEMRPPCVVVDVDETILDNSVFQKELIQSDTEYESSVWNEFVQRRASPAIDGAVEFVQACRASGVKVFFVTNREASVEAATRDNLISQGLVLQSDPDRILSKNEQPDWSSDKASRRRAVAEKYRVLLLVGDDLNDFLSAKNLTIEERQQLYLANKNNWGQSWFVMPNPNYGSWEQTTYGHDYQAPLEKKRELKMQTLSDVDVSN